jgi:hypothetical protein
MNKDKQEKVDKLSILNEMIEKQLKSTPANKKMSFGDLNRMIKYIDRSIFNTEYCCLWSGYVTNSNVVGKVQYINFYFKKRKTALHRILYGNFVKDLGDDEYLKFTCENRGKCCNVNHMRKFAYSTRGNNVEVKKNEDSDDSDNENDTKSKASEEFSISFS